LKTTLLIACDGIRALLHQRLLLGLMLIALALIGIFSAVLISQQKMVTQSITYESEANASVGEDASGKASAKESGDAAKANPNAGERQMSKEDRQKLATSLDQMSSMFQAAFYQVASFGGSLVSLFIFSTAVTGEIRKGTIRITLTKPVSRTQYLLGKYLGGVAVMAAYALIASAAILLFAWFGHLELSPAMKFAPWLMFCRQLMLGSLAMLLSLCVHPFLAAALAFFAGNGLYSHYNPLFYIFPSYSAFNVFGQVLAGTLIGGREVLVLSFYALDFVVLMLLVALWRFRTKELI
jgi:ABC-type transport system involved in multi-copper enzyme maturation permease subunit